MAAFDRFRASYTLTPAEQAVGEPVEPWDGPDVPDLDRFRETFAGCTFEDGLYRVHDRESAHRAREWVEAAFPGHHGRVLPFAYDWAGSQFCLDAERDREGELLVLIFEPGTGEVLRVPCTLAEFHDRELVDEAESAVTRSFFEAWSQRHQTDVPLGRDQCVGYRIPLFLGGQDDVDNLELTDLAVYWELTAQMLARL